MKEVLIEVVEGPEGPCIYINDYRVAGPKPRGQRTAALHKFTAKLKNLRKALENLA